MSPETGSLKGWIESTLKEKLTGAVVEVHDMTGTNDHFQALVVAEEFDGKMMVEQHRLVYEALGDAMKAKIHALSLKTMTPGEWEKFKNA
jgi:stress-induced morphogen